MILLIKRNIYLYSAVKNMELQFSIMKIIDLYVNMQADFQ